MSTSYWKKQADRWFSYYIRLRDTEHAICQCYTCGRRMHPKNAHCGHYVGRQHTATRYDRTNCHTQCPICNTFNEGEKRKYAAQLDTDYGAGTAENLEIIGKTRGKYGSLWYQTIAVEYKNLATHLAQKKGVRWW